MERNEYTDQHTVWRSDPTIGRAVALHAIGAAQQQIWDALDATIAPSAAVPTEWRTRLHEAERAITALRTELCAQVGEDADRTKTLDAEPV